MQEQKLRPVRLEDASQIAEIYNHYVLETTISFETEAVSEHEMRARIADISSHYPYFVIEKNGRISGYCYAHEWKRRNAYQYTLETTLYLHPEAKGQGLGTLLMNALTEACRQAGFRALVACITADNEPSIRLHEKLGFTRASFFPAVGYKFGEMLDVTDYILQL